jgi:hypothetical protein
MVAFLVISRKVVFLGVSQRAGQWQLYNCHSDYTSITQFQRIARRILIVVIYC